MNEEKILEEFRERLKYKKAGILIILLSIIPVVMFDGFIKYLLSGLIFVLGVYIGRKYRCPSCDYVFDNRLASNELIYCPKCGVRLQYR